MKRTRCLRKQNSSLRRFIDPAIREALETGAKLPPIPDVSHIRRGRRQLTVIRVRLAAFLLRCPMSEIKRMVNAGEAQLFLHNDGSFHVEYAPISRRIFDTGRTGVNSGLSLGQVARIIKCELGVQPSRQTITRLIKRGLLKGHRLSTRGSWLVDRESLKRFVSEVRDAPPN